MKKKSVSAATHTAAIKSACLLFLFIFSLASARLSAQGAAVLTGTGMSTCAPFSFGICPGQTITPIYYNSMGYACDHGMTEPFVSFNILGTSWRVHISHWSFSSNTGGQLSGFDQLGSPQSVTFGISDIVAPAAYTTISGVDYVTFNINGSPVSFLLSKTTFSLSINNLAPLSPATFTYCPDTAASIAISPGVPTGGPTDFDWQPGSLSGNPLSVSPAVTTVYTVTGSYGGNCPTSTTVDVEVVSCGSSTGCCLGNYCGASPNALAGDYQVPMKSHNFNFTTPASSKASVLIGRTACSGFSARLDVEDDVFGRGIYGYSSTGKFDNIGIHGAALNPSPGPGSGLVTIGVQGETDGFSKNNQKDKYAGVAGFVGTPNYGLMPNGMSIGVYGNSTSNGGTWAGYFDGDVNINGSAFCTAMTWSDKRFKKNITKLASVSDKIAALQGYTYDYRTDEFKNKNFPAGQQIGFIAQELKEVFPQLVTDDKQGYLAVNYAGFIPVLLQGFKEQKQQIDELKALVNTLSGNTANATTPTSIPVSLSDKNAIVLNQNVPNPFAESTVISYNIPSDFTKAQIIFSTSDGSVIKVVNITEKGAGSLSVFANDLSHGLYTYALVVDGKTIDAKKMVKE